MRKIITLLLIISSFICFSQTSKSIIGVDKKFRPGEKNIMESPSPKVADYMLVFEDDGDTGYIYVLSLNSPGNPIVDALHIYNVKDVTDKKVKSNYKIVWSQDGTKGALFINDYCHAIVDYSENGAYNRNGFPPPEENKWVKKGHKWDDSKLNLFKL